MAKHHFQCDSCGSNLVVAQEAIGAQIKCPQCNTAIAVPTDAEVANRAEQARKRSAAEEVKRKAVAEEEARRKELERREQDEQAKEARRRQQQEKELLSARDHLREQAAVARELREPDDPRSSASFLDTMGIVMIVTGIVAVVGGAVVAFKIKNSMPIYVGIAVLVQCFWFASITFLATGIARNIFRMVRKLNDIESSKRG